MMGHGCFAFLPHHPRRCAGPPERCLGLGVPAQLSRTVATTKGGWLMFRTVVTSVMVLALSAGILAADQAKKETKKPSKPAPAAVAKQAKAPAPQVKADQFD